MDTQTKRATYLRLRTEAMEKRERLQDEFDSAFFLLGKAAFEFGLFGQGLNGHKLEDKFKFRMDAQTKRSQELEELDKYMGELDRILQEEC